MTVRRPLVVVNGQTQELPLGDSVASGLGFPFFKADGGQANIVLSNGLPFYKADGTQSNINLV